MNILLDHCVPAPLAKLLVGHQVRMAYDLGWSELRNGELISTAEKSNFDILITCDKNWRYQQNLRSRQLAILVLPTNNWVLLQGMATAITNAVALMKRGDYLEL